MGFPGCIDRRGQPDAIRLIDNVGGVRYGTILTSTDYPGDPDLVWDPILGRYLIVWSYTNAAGRRAVMGDLRDGDANRSGVLPIRLLSLPQIRTVSTTHV